MSSGALVDWILDGECGTNDSGRSSRNLDVVRARGPDFRRTFISVATRAVGWGIESLDAENWLTGLSG
jgi:hypothetical protein